MLHEIELKNVLSYGPEGQKLALGPLNVLIGPNGGGKSNFLDVLGFLKALPSDVASLIAETGGIVDWLWHGDTDGSAEVRAVLSLPKLNGGDERTFCYRIGFGRLNQYFAIRGESLIAGESEASKGELFMESDEGEASLSSALPDGTRSTISGGSSRNTSVMTQYKDATHYPELTALANELADFALYRDWFFGRSSPARQPQKPDYPAAYLMEDGRNLGLVLNRLSADPDARQRFIEALKQLYSGITDFHVGIEFGTVRIDLREGRTLIPATRLSDGTMRYMALLAVLCHPDPPALVCIEEPEIGLHPDVVVEVADLLRDASERCQLIVTTHSDVLVDALTDVPESVVVCEKPEGQTQLRRLDPDDLKSWLEDYRLGQLWTSGEIGGNRW